MNPTAELAERLKKASPDQLADFAERLVKRAEHINKAHEGLVKAQAHQEKMKDHLDNMKDSIDDLHEHLTGAKDALTSKAVGGSDTLHKSVMDSAENIKNLYAGVLTESEGISEGQDLISGAIEEWASEADAQVDAGIAAATRWSESPVAGSKIFRSMMSEIRGLKKSLERSQRATERKVEQAIEGLAGGISKGFDAASTSREQAFQKQVPLRTAMTTEKSNDGTGETTVVKINSNGGGNPAEVKTSVSPLLADGVTPNPEYTKLAEAQGDACQKSLRDLKEQHGNPFIGMEELVGAGGRH